MMRRALAALILLTLPFAGFARGQQDPKKKKGALDFQAEFQAKVDGAIKKGVAFLKGGGSDELVLLTLIHAGRDFVPENDPQLQQGLNAVLTNELTNTYRVALAAMALEELDRVKYQARLWQCAQFLVDNQGANGQWTYGEPTPFLKDVPTGTPVKANVASGSGKRAALDFDPPGKRKPVRLIPVKKRRDGPASGDNSNSQYAALGLRACHDAGIVLPEAVIRLAHKWWTDNCSGGGSANNNTATGGVPNAPPRSWGYGGGGECGALTAGSIGALAIYDYILDNDEGKRKSWTRDAAVLGGIAWLAQNFKPNENCGTCDVGLTPSGILYYYLYAIERAGMLYGTEYFGRHEWYAEGAKVLLKEQKADGSWTNGDQHFGPVIDTCFAILFLRRATRPLDVATEGGPRK